MYSLHDWQDFSIVIDGGFVTTSIGVNAQNIETVAQMENKKH